MSTQKASKSKVRFFDKRFMEIFSSEIVSIIGGLIAGTVLALATGKLLLIPGMLIVLPGFLEMRGNISGSFASRLTSGLFLKVIKPSDIRSRIVRENVLASFLLAIGLSLIFGFFLFLFHFLVLHQIMLRLFFLPLLAGVIANAIEIPLTLIVTFWLFKKGHDPNNIIGPFITSTGDITSILALLVSFLILI